jgi:hypothetical protein
MGQYCVAAPNQFLDSDLFHRFFMTPTESGVVTSGIEKVSSLSFHPYRNHQNPIPYTFWASI